jgi:hypothetical protein
MNVTTKLIKEKMEQQRILNDEGILRENHLGILMCLLLTRRPLLIHLIETLSV